MDTPVPDGPNARFSRDVAKAAFHDETAADLAANAADVALLIDDRGVVRDAACSGDDLDAEDLTGWIGRKWIDLVQEDSREKVIDLLDPAEIQAKRRWRHVNHRQSDGPDLPVRYFTLPAGREGWTLAIGRDLRAASRMQQRLIEAQRSMEADYARVREAETRFRLLFQLASEGVVVIDGEKFRLTDVNPAAARLLGQSSQRLEGRSLDGAFGAAAGEQVREILAVARKTGRTEQLDFTPDGAEGPLQMLASVYRQGRQVYFLARLALKNAAEAEAGDAALSRLAEILPDGLVLIAEDGRILSANDAFADLAQLSDPDAALGDPVDRYLGRTETEVNVLLANLREHGVILNFATLVRTRHDLREPVELSAVAAPGPSGNVYGFSIRPVGRRLVPGRRAEAAAIPGSVDKLSDLVGRVALKDIVRESTDMIERNCIEAALELTNDNRASAAEILGLSRQSLYAKMHRHKIGELQPRTEN